MDPKKFFIYRTVQGENQGFQTESLTDLREGPNFYAPSVLSAALQAAIEDPEINLCKGDIKREYIEYAFGANTHRFFVMKDVTEPKVYGILFAKRVGAGIYLDVVCASGSFGSIFLNYFFDYCQKSGFEFIKLSSLATVLSYYPRLGFQHRKSCASAADLAFPPSLLTDIKTRRRKEKGRLLDAEGKLNPTTECEKTPQECGSLLEDVYELLKYPPFQEFLDQLRKHGYTAKGSEYWENSAKYQEDFAAAEKVIRDAATQLKKEKESAYEYKEREYRAAFLKAATDRYQTVIAPAKYRLSRLSCANPQTSLVDFIHKFDCYEDGFTMVKCLREAHTPSKGAHSAKPKTATKKTKTKQKTKRSPARIPASVKKTLSARRSKRLAGTKRIRSPSPKQTKKHAKRNKRTKKSK